MNTVKNILDVLEGHAKNQGNQLSFQYLTQGKISDSNPKLNYKSLLDSSINIASHLQHLSIDGENAVLCYPAGLDFIQVFYGCFFAGVVAVPAPVYSLKSHQTKENIQTIILDSNAMVILTTREIAQNYLIGENKPPTGCKIIETDYLEVVNDHVWKKPSIGKDSIAYIQYTSGSINNPKGVVITHGNIIDNAQQVKKYCRLNSNTVGVGWLPHSHDMQIMAHIISPVFAGCSQIIMSTLDFMTKPSRLLEAISHFRAQISGGPNIMYDLLNKQDLSELNLDLSCWEVAFCGAEPINAKTVIEFCKKFTSVGLPKNAFSPCYGLAEATSYVTSVTYARSNGTSPWIIDVLTQELEKNKFISSHRLNKSSETTSIVASGIKQDNIVIIDPDSLAICADGNIGEVYVSDGSIGSGYWGQPKISKITFANRIPSKNGDYLKTGDLGCFYEGYFYIIGRIKDLIIINGRNIYPYDIEIFIEELDPQVRPNQTAVFSVKNKDSNLDEVIVVTKYRGLDAEKKQFIDQVKMQVFSYFSIIVHDIILLKNNERLPKTSSGKIKRPSCRELYLSKKNLVKKERIKQNSLESLELFVFEKIKKQSNFPNLISIDTPVKDLGIDSLDQVALVLEIEKILNKSISITFFYQPSTLKEAINALLLPSDSKDEIKASSKQTTVYDPENSKLKHIDKRKPESYRFDIEKDLDFSRVNDSLYFFPQEFITSIGLAIEHPSKHNKEGRFIHWAVAASICAYIEVLELFICKFLETQNTAIPTTQSIEWFATEEEKHVRMFRKLADHITSMHPEEHQYLIKCWHGHNSTSLEPFTRQELFENKTLHHYACWLLALFFEEWSVYFGRYLLDNDLATNSVWLKAHQIHADEEIHHVITDAAYIEALNISDKQRYDYSRKVWAWLHVNVFGWLFSSKAIQEFIFEYYPHIQFNHPVSITSNQQWHDVLESTWFKRTRKAFPYLQDVSTQDKKKWPTEETIESYIPEQWLNVDTGNRKRRQQDHTSLIELNAQGDETPLILVHSGLGGIEPFLSFLNYWPDSHPLYALQSRGLEQEYFINQNITEMAQDYAQQIMERFPRGRIQLGGYSQGGVIAFMMSHILEQNKYEVSSLILIDSWLPGTMRVEPKTDDVEKENILLQLKEMNYPIPSFVYGNRTINSDNVFELIEAFLMQTEQIHKIDTIKRRSQISMNSLKLFTQSLDRSLKIHADIHLIKATKAVAVPGISKVEVEKLMLEQSDYGWGERSYGHVYVSPISANHLDICSIKHAKKVVSWMGAVIVDGSCDYA